MSVNANHPDALISSAMIVATAVEQLESVQYLYLRKLSEPRDHSLKLVVEEAVVNHAVPANFDPELEAVLTVASPIESVEGCRVFRASLETLRRISGHGRIGRLELRGRVR
jgi:hypothetical protein